MRRGATDEELALPLAGDGLVQNPQWTSTQAITIHFAPGPEGAASLPSPPPATFYGELQAGGDVLHQGLRLHPHQSDRVTGVRGGLAVATIWFGTILAATVGVIAASVTMLGLIALPAMLQRGYAKGIATGACTAGGSLGILIPPSIMLIIYGPMANISVGKLFIAAFPAGLTLSLLYTVYILVRCHIRPNEAPVMPLEERNVPLNRKLRLLFTALLPPVFLVLAVLGSIFFGIAAPTEAAAVGALASALMAAAYRKLNLRVLRDCCYTTAGTFSMVFIVVVGATFFTIVFLGLGCGQVVNSFVLAAPGGKWGIFFILMFIVFILGMLIDWIGIVLIMVPIVTPIAAQLGFDHHQQVVGLFLRVDGQTATRNVLFPEPLKYSAFPDPEIQLTRLRDDLLQVEVQRPAKGLWLSAGDDIEWSDNMLDIVPSNARTVEAKGLGKRAVRAQWYGGSAWIE